MLKLNKNKIIKAGGKVIKEKKQKEESFCKVYTTPKDVIKYYNNPNNCINCNKIIPASTLVNYTELKSKIFCSKHCEKKYFEIDNEVELLRRKVIYDFYLALADCVNLDMIALDYRIDDAMKSKMLDYVNAFEDDELEF